MNYSQVESDNIARGNRLAIDWDPLYLSFPIKKASRSIYMYFTWPVAFSSISGTLIYVIRPPGGLYWENNARSLEYRPQPTASGGTQARGHSFSQYRPIKAGELQFFFFHKHNEILSKRTRMIYGFN